jgi:hypothetical protein
MGSEGRDRRDDLAHLADAPARDVLHDGVGQMGVLVVEQLVDEPADAVVLDVEAAPQADAVRGLGGGGVERLSGRRAPVDREQLVVLGRDRVAPDVERAAADVVDAAEVQRPARGGVAAQPLPPHRLQHLLGEVVARARAAAQRAQQPLVRRPGLVQMRLLGVELLHAQAD